METITIKPNLTGETNPYMFESHIESKTTINNSKMNPFKSLSSNNSDVFAISQKLTLVNVRVPHNDEFVLSPNDNSVVSFIYCKSGSMQINFSNDGKIKLLSKYQTAIVSGGKNDRVTIKNNNSELCELTVILIKGSKFPRKQSEDVMQKLLYLITDGEENSRIYYTCSKNLRILAELNELNEVKEKGIVQKLIIAGKVRTILALAYQQLLDDIDNASYAHTSLTKTDMQKIESATKLINENYHQHFSINQLCQEIGLSASKLQEGFKLMHKHTVTEYIRNVRLEQAERLLKTTDYNVSEVVYMVGFTSRSYFSKIFKEKYRCKPREYKQDFERQVA